MSWTWPWSRSKPARTRSWLLLRMPLRLNPLLLRLLLRHHHPLWLCRTHLHDRLHGHHLRLRLSIHRLLRVLHHLRLLLRYITGRRAGVRLLRSHILSGVSLLHPSRRWEGSARRSRNHVGDGCTGTIPIVCILSRIGLCAGRGRRCRLIGRMRCLVVHESFTSARASP